MLKISLRRLTLIGYPSMPYLLSPIIFLTSRAVRRVIIVAVDQITLRGIRDRVPQAVLHSVDLVVADLVAEEPLEVSRTTGHDGIERINAVFLFTKFIKARYGIY